MGHQRGCWQPVQHLPQYSRRAYLLHKDPKKKENILHLLYNIKLVHMYQVLIAQWSAWRLATGDVPGSNLGKEDNLINFLQKRKFN